MTRTRRINGCTAVFERSPGVGGWSVEVRGRRAARGRLSGQTIYALFSARRLADLRRTVHAMTARP